MFIWVSPQFVRGFDAVHCIEFRQGWTLLPAIWAKMNGLHVVYDHEQRGDRHFSVAHTIDSGIRRLLIFIGSIFVNHVRHTQVANAEHFLSSTFMRPKMVFAPLGGDETRFRFSLSARKRIRRELSLRDDVPLAVVSGKISETKRVLQVLRACRKSGWTPMLIGQIDEAIKSDLEKAADQRSAILVGWQPSGKLSDFYSAADVAIFTTFTVSYWETALTGLPTGVPGSHFAHAYVTDKDVFHLFGSPDMFGVEDELYHSHVDITEELEKCLRQVARVSPAERRALATVSWEVKRSALVEFYQREVFGGCNRGADG